MGKHIEVLETISGPNNSDSIGVNNKLEYNADRQWADFDNRELPSKEAIAEAISDSTGVPVNLQPVPNGDTPITLTPPFGYSVWKRDIYLGIGGNDYGAPDNSYITSIDAVNNTITLRRDSVSDNYLIVWF
jgi:hypothetical protein